MVTIGRGGSMFGSGKMKRAGAIARSNSSGRACNITLPHSLLQLVSRYYERTFIKSCRT